MASSEESLKLNPRLEEFLTDLWGLSNEGIKETYWKLKIVAVERQIHFPREKEEWENDLEKLDADMLKYVFSKIKIIASGKKIDLLDDSGTRHARDLTHLNPVFEPADTSSSGMPTADQTKRMVQQLEKDDLHQLYKDMALMLHERGIITDETNQGKVNVCSGPVDNTKVKRPRNQGDDRHYNEEESRQKIAALEEQLNELSKSKAKSKDKYKERCTELEQKLEHANASYQSLNQRASQTLQEMQARIQKLEANEAEYRNKIRSLDDEKNELLRRLSVIAGAKLSDNNPNLTDLSDMNRPQKIGEKYSDLYDNEWTDAFEYLEEQKEKPMTAIMKLLNTFEDCFEFCQKQASENLGVLLSAATNPLCHWSPTDTSASAKATPKISREKCPPEVSQRIVDMRKATAKLVIPLVKEEYYKKLKEFDGVKIVKGGDCIKKYVDKCVEICWYASVQDPPLVLTTDFPPYSPYDSNVTRNYTKSGKYVEYVVWPALLLHDKGPLLSKGVVQCTNTAKGEVKEKKVHRMKRKNSQDNQID